MPYPIHPHHVFAPGESLSEMIGELDISQEELAARMGLTAKTVSQLINGKAPITPNIADKLEYVTGASCSFWLNLENNYRRFLKEREERTKLQEAREFAALFPYAELVKRGACPATRNAAEKKEALLRFFGVSDIAAYRRTYISPLQGAARICFPQKWNPHSFAAWLRLAELQARKIETVGFTKAGLQEAIRAIRALACNDIAKAWKPIENILANCGVAAVIEPELPGCRISGFTRFIGPRKALLVLSLRSKRVGAFWFNLFHELCHLLKHGKKKTFYNFGGQPEGQTPQLDQDRDEAEADAFSRRILISDKAWDSFVTGKSSFSARAVKAFAIEAGVPCDVVQGRLEWEQRIG